MKGTGTIILNENTPNGSIKIESNGKVYTVPRIGCEEVGGRLGYKVGDRVSFCANDNDQVVTFHSYNPGNEDCQTR